MVTDEFVEKARHTADYESGEEVREVARATMYALGDSVSRGEATNLAARLPADLSDAMLEPETPEPKAPSVEAFLDEVAERASIDRENAQSKVQGVFAAVAGLVEDEELANARSQLPPGYDRVFEPGRTLRGEPFAEAVRRRADLDSKQEAKSVTRTVFAVFGQRLSRGEAEDLAQFLPKDVSDALAEAGEQDAETFDRDEFYQRVADREDIDEETARTYSEAVFAVLVEVVSDEELDRALDQLPPTYEALVQPAD